MMQFCPRREHRYLRWKPLLIKWERRFLRLLMASIVLGCNTGSDRGFSHVPVDCRAVAATLHKTLPDYTPPSERPFAELSTIREVIATGLRINGFSVHTENSNDDGSIMVSNGSHPVPVKINVVNVSDDSVVILVRGDDTIHNNKRMFVVVCVAHERRISTKVELIH